MKKNPKQIEKNKLKKFIIAKFIEPASIVWARDMKLVTRLVNLYLEKEFWEFLPENKFLSIAQLLTENSLKYLNEEYQMFKLEKTKPKPYPIQEQQEIPNSQNKPENIKEFLNL